MKFIHFGCWNEGRCDLENGNNGVSTVISSLLNTYEHEIKFYIIAGDNYYPNKNEKGEKIFDRTDFESGFNCIKQLTLNGTPVYLLMGNHDVVHKKDILEEGNLLEMCDILKYQLSYRNNLNINSIHKHLKDYHTLILFLNTNLYDEDIREDTTLPCQRLYRDGYPEVVLKNLESIINYEENIFLQLVSNYLKNDNTFKNIILVGHHPIYSIKYKQKKKEDTVKMSTFSFQGLKFLDLLFSMFENDVNKYYLCADIHHYQSGTLQLNNHTIKQQVVGTGGTECDKINRDIVGINKQFSQNVNSPKDNLEEVIDSKDDEETIRLTLTIDNIIDKHGYLQCELDELHNFSSEFIPVLDCDYKDKVGGKYIRKIKQKTKKNKNI